MRTRVATRFGLPALLTAHGLALAAGAWVHSPAWDEWGHLPAGLSHWHFARFDMYRVNPPLVRMVAALPIVFCDVKIEWPGIFHDSRQRPEFLCPSRMAKANGDRVFWYFTLARWACIPFSVLGGWICFRWASELYDAPAGLTALTLWCFSPTLLGTGQLITPDTAAAALGAGAFYVFWKWLCEPTWSQSLFTGLVLGAAELTKFTWVILFGVWPLLWLIWRFSTFRLPGAREVHGDGRGQDGPGDRIGSEERTCRMDLRKDGSASTHQRWGNWRGELGQLGAMLGLAVCVINLGYGFEGAGTRLGDFRFVSPTLRFAPSDESPVTHLGAGNRFAETGWAGVPIPLPANYVLGIDRQKYDFELGAPSYLRGEWRDRGWWYYYLYALSVKVPLGTWLLVLLALCVGLFTRGYAAGWRDELMLIAPIVVVLTLVSSQTGFNHHMRYVLPIFPFAFIWMSKLARCVEFRHWKLCGVAGAALVWSIGSSLYYFPHSLSYFNELVGGPKHGHDHLLDSNIDWGQDLLLFKRWLAQHPEATPIGLAYSLPQDLLDPTDVGIEYAPVPVGRGEMAVPGGAATVDSLGPRPGWYAIFVRELRGRHRRYEYFRRFEPVEVIGYTVYVYHITPREANRVRREMGLPEIEDSKSRRVEDLRT